MSGSATPCRIPANIPPGCRFHPRCPLAFDRCPVEAPKKTPNGAGFVECHLAESV
jgi:peptide/nickel transport system ATP-binding protein